MSGSLHLTPFVGLLAFWEMLTSSTTQSSLRCAPKAACCPFLLVLLAIERFLLRLPGVKAGLASTAGPAPSSSARQLSISMRWTLPTSSCRSRGKHATGSASGHGYCSTVSVIVQDNMFPGCRFPTPCQQLHPCHRLERSHGPSSRRKSEPDASFPQDSGCKCDNALLGMTTQVFADFRCWLWC